MIFGHFKYLNRWIGSLVWSMPWSWVESTAVTALTAVNHSTAVTKAAKTTPKGTIGWSLSHVPTLFRKKLHFKGRVLKIKLSKMYHQSTWNVFFFLVFRKIHQKTRLVSWNIGPCGRCASVHVAQKLGISTCSPEFNLLSTVDRIR